jgi:hypothetical protein
MKKEMLTEVQLFQRWVKAASRIEPLSGPQSWIEDDENKIVNLLQFLREANIPYRTFYITANRCIEGWMEPHPRAQIYSGFRPRRMLVTIDPAMKNTHIIVYSEDEEELFILAPVGTTPEVTGQEYESHWCESRMDLGCRLIELFQLEVIDKLRKRVAIEAPTYGFFGDEGLKVFPTVYFALLYDPRKQRPGRITANVRRSIDTCIALPCNINENRFLENGKRGVEYSVMFEIP